MTRPAFVTEERWAQVLAHAKRHHDEGLVDNDVSLLITAYDDERAKVDAAVKERDAFGDANRRASETLRTHSERIAELEKANRILASSKASTQTVLAAARDTMEAIAQELTRSGVGFVPLVTRLRETLRLSPPIEDPSALNAAHVMRLRAALNIDRSGLARALSSIVSCIGGTVPCTADESKDDEIASLKATVKTVDEIARTALRASGDLATAAVRGDPHAEIDDCVTVTLTRDELRCAAKGMATYSLGRQMQGKPTSIADAVVAKLQGKMGVDDKVIAEVKP